MTRIWLALCCVLALVSAAAAAPVTIDSGAYTGRYFVADEEFIGTPGMPAMLDLADGTYSLDTGAGSGGSSFTFSVAGGAIVSVSNAEAATYAGATLTLQTTPITINPGAYAGRYFLSSHSYDVVGYGGFSGSRTVAVVAGLEYAIDDGAEVAGSAFLFTVTGGVVTNVSSGAATASGSAITFNTASVTINPARYTGRYYLTSNEPGQYFTGAQTLDLITTLVYGLDNYSSIDGSAFYFAVDATGQVSTTSAAATATGGTLTLLNVLVAVDPGGYAGVYRLGGYTELSGPALVTVMPTLLTTVGAEPQFTSVTPGFTTVTPNAVTLVLSGQPYTFTFNLLSVGALAQQVQALPLSAGLKNSLLAKLQAAQKQLQRGNTATVASQLTAFVNQLNALEQNGTLPPLYGNLLIAEAESIISQL